MSDEKKLMPLSASKLKVLSSCSYQFFSKYILKVPEPSSTSATAVGTIVHNVLEETYKETRRITFKKAIKNGSAKTKKISDYVISESKKWGVNSEEELAATFKMIDQTLNIDFFGEERGEIKEGHAELFFDVNRQDIDGRPFRILGYIDRLDLYEDDYVTIRDYKSSKKIFEGKDKTNNLQSLLYSYAADHLYPGTTSHTEFWFLKHDLCGDGRLILPPITKYELIGLESELADYQQIVENFDEEAAHSAFAFDKGFPTDGSFSCKLMCGFSKSPEDKFKKNGDPKFSCSFKWPRYYYVLFNEKDERIDAAVEEELPRLREKKAASQENLKIKKYLYQGCPKWNK